MLFVERCAICDEVGPSPCAPCLVRLPPASDSAVPAGLDSFATLFAYEDTGRRLVTAVKYRNQRAGLDWMGRRLASHLRAQRAEVVTWVPSSLPGRRRRGFDTGELLARAVGRRLRLPVKPLLERWAAESQSTRDRGERHLGPSIRATPWAVRRLDVAGVVLVDDVLTTGASMTAAARALKEQCGVRYVAGATAARTPLYSNVR
jgi:competence protein ComFC